MSKKHFIALADYIRGHNHGSPSDDYQDNDFTPIQIETLADFCADQNPRFNRARWIDYIHGKCGKNGGRVKQSNPALLT